ncbi:hypothetical protein PENTCL1PPCAC_7771, partial [Pristionchus entomophagus]
QMLKHVRFFSKTTAPTEKEVEEEARRSPAGGDYSSRSTVSPSRLGSVRQQCDIFSITGDPATEFEEAPAPVPPSIRLTWRLLSLISLAHVVLLLVNVVLLFSVDNKGRKSHQQVLLFSLLMLTNLVLVIVMILVVVRQDKAITQCAICCTFWTAFAYFVILAYNSLDDPLALAAGRTCLTVIIMTVLELATLAVYFVLRFIRYKKVVELYNCRACICDKDCVKGRAPTRLAFSDLWPRSEAPAEAPRQASSVDPPTGSLARESPISEPLPPTPFM